MPTIEEVVSKLPQATVFSTLDATCGYWQIPVEEKSSKLLTFNTPYGRFCFRRLPFGISSASEVFQRTMNQLFGDIEGCEIIVDDILVWGRDVAEHDGRLLRVLERARKVGLRLKQEKCKIKVPQLKYIGHTLTAEGLKPDPEKVAAVQQMPEPQSKKELRRFLGMVNYLAKFIPDLAQKTSVIRDLLKERNEWSWQPEHKKCFDELKTACSSQPTLVYYDVSKPVKISCDSSKYGLGAVCLQDEKPVAYASRTLSETEQRYAQIEKEPLAIVYACERFHQYIYGRTVQIESDHKPLESIFQKPLYQSPLRLQRMLLKLQRYDLKVTYKKGTQLHIADTLSRACLSTEQETQLEDLIVHVTIPFSAEKSEQLKAATRSDPIALRKTILQGWPQHKRSIDPSIQEYWDFSETLSIYDDVIFKGEKIVIPTSMITTILKVVHSGHRGADVCKRRAREAVYWPSMSKDIQDHVDRCEACKEAKPQQQKEPLLSPSTPTRPWQYLQDTRATTIIKKIKMHISRYGIPDKLMSDNGPQFANNYFKKFTADYGIEHITSSPRYPQSNGYAERAVQTAKKILTAATRNNEDPYLALLDHRNTPRDDILGSPAQRLMARRMKTLLPTSETLLQPSIIVPSEVTKRLTHYRQQSKRYHDRTAKPLQKLKSGDVIRAADSKGKYTKKGTVLSETSYPRSYIVNVNGQNIRRNRRHLLKVKEEPDNEYEWETIIEPTNAQECEPNAEPTNAQECEPNAELTNEQQYDTRVEPGDITIQHDNGPQACETKRSRYGRAIRPPNRLNL